MTRPPEAYAMRVLTAVLFAIPLLAPAAFGQAADPDPAPKPVPIPAAVMATAPSGWYVEARAGFASQQLDDLDANIAFVEEIAVSSLEARGPFRRFENAQAFGLELGYRRSSVNVGILGELQRQRPRTFAAGDSIGALDAISLLSTIDVRLAASYRPRWLYGFELGGSAGLAFAHYSESFSIYVYEAPQFNTSYGGAYHAVSFSGGPHLAWRRPLFGATWLVARAAWVYRNFDELEGQYRQRQGGQIEVVDDSLRRLSDGEFASIDGSGVQVTAGLSYTFGARR
jgi:hypothetical protein